MFGSAELEGKKKNCSRSKTEPVKVPAAEKITSPLPSLTEELRRDGSTFRLISMQFSLSDLKLKDNVDTLKSTLNSFVHNMPKIQVICCIFNF